MCQDFKMEKKSNRTGFKAITYACSSCSLNLPGTLYTHYCFFFIFNFTAVH